MSGIWLPFAAVTISVFLAVIFFIKQNNTTSEVRLYKWTLVINVIFSLNATLAYIIAETTTLVPLVSFLQKIHLSLLLTVGCCLLVYNVIINNFGEKNYQKIRNILSIINTIIVALIFISPIETIIDGEILDVGGMSYNIMMTFLMIYFVILIILNIRYIITG